MSHLDRRYFPRVNYRAHATLTTPDARWPVHILDLSFNGALAAIIHKNNLKAGETVVLRIELDDNELIRMQGRLTHKKEHFLGIECRATGIDNQARLRELLEEHKTDRNRSFATMLDEHQEH